MPFISVTANIAVAKALDCRHENMVLIKPSTVSVSLYHDLAKTLPVASCPIGETTLEIMNNPLLAGELFIESSANTQPVTINYW